MRASDWGESLKEARKANPTLSNGEISTIASKIHHEKRKAAATRRRISGKTMKEFTEADERHCVKWEYPGEGKKKKPPPKRRLPVRSQPPIAKWPNVD
jgi:hypothetical protein